MEIGVVHRPKPGREISGDAYTIHENEHGILVALVDGLGAGDAAHEAATRAIDTIAQHVDASLPEILYHCHEALQDTRGAVMMLMRIDNATQTVGFAGVGNIGVRTYSQEPIKPISRNGIVGYRMPEVREFRYPYHPGDLFVLFSDGISGRFDLYHDRNLDPRNDTPQELAEKIATFFGKEDDDITVLVLRERPNELR